MMEVLSKLELQADLYFDFNFKGKYREDFSLNLQSVPVLIAYAVPGLQLRHTHNP